MFSALFETGPRTKRTRVDRSPFASSYARTTTPVRNPRLLYNQRRAIRYEDENDEENESQTGSSESNVDNNEDGDSVTTDEEQDENGERAALLPLFDSTHLDTLPIYTLTHTIRLMVVSKCETVLSWEQLRSPQVSQFLLKPIQQEVMSDHFSASTLYCLMANCLQFTKEVALYPGNSGTSQTRAMICELLAIKLLREYSTRGLIDALSYDFDPLQGQGKTNSAPLNGHRPSWQPATKRLQPRFARISCLEIAIRAQAKRFLAHPVVVQQLEAIWDGSIVFHAAADNLHRHRSPLLRFNYGTNAAATDQPIEFERKGGTYAGSRKVVTLYNPRDASLFKLSRLRVPRYRNILSTLSFAILLGLFTAVLIQRSLHITPLEVLFWIWAAGYMVEEVVGFTEQGSGLYLASFWNTMDLGILLLLLLHLCLRIYGIVMPDIRKRDVANTAYDVLAADAILLFPRLFSVLDHYRYFSQLIIAFRLMSADFAAVCVLLVVSCSGFFVALTLSFGYGDTSDPSEVAYVLVQMILGFTPAVWDRWDRYTPLGRFILVSFLFLCHFVILTILITVLTNSFTAVVKNANEEHQFIFAVNTISNVKSDALFSYVPPLNVLQWLLNPLRYILPFKQFIRLNRTVIKATHFPILLLIFLYERWILQPAVVDRIDVVDQRRRLRSKIARRLPRLVREASIGTLRQDRALEEVFKQPIDATIRTDVLNKTKSSTVVSKWMDNMGNDVVNPPQEDDPNTMDRLERRHLGERSLSAFSRVRKSAPRVPSVASDPGEIASHPEFFNSQTQVKSIPHVSPTPVDTNMHEDAADGDDEMATNDHEDDRLTIGSRQAYAVRSLLPMDYFTHRKWPMSRTPARAASIKSGNQVQNDTLGPGQLQPTRVYPRKRPNAHTRNISSSTMIFNPAVVDDGQSNDENLRPQTALNSGNVTPGSKQPSSGGRKTPKKVPSKMRPVFPGKEDPSSKSVPNLQGLLRPVPPAHPRRSSLEMDLVSDLGDNQAIGGGYVGALPASFVTQMAYATGGIQKLQKERNNEQEMYGRLMMARMNTLEEGFREVIHEVRENMKGGSRNRSPERPAQIRRERRAAPKQDGKGKEKPDSSSVDSGSIGSGPLMNAQRSAVTVVHEQERARIAGAVHSVEDRDRTDGASLRDDTEG